MWSRIIRVQLLVCVCVCLCVENATNYRGNNYGLLRFLLKSPFLFPRVFLCEKNEQALLYRQLGILVLSCFLSCVCVCLSVCLSVVLFAVRALVLIELPLLCPYYLLLSVCLSVSVRSVGLSVSQYDIALPLR